MNVKQVVLLLLVLISSMACSTGKFQYETLGTAPDLSRLTPEEKSFYLKNADLLEKSQWVNWIYEDSQSERSRMRKKLETLLYPKVNKEANSRNRVRYLGCAKINDEELDSFVFVTANTEIDRCVTNEASNKRGFYAFPRVFIEKKSKERTYQIYVLLALSEWAFLNTYSYQYRGDLISDKPLVQIDQKVTDGGGINEHHYAEIPKKHWEEFLKNGVKIKVRGKRDSAEFELSAKTFSDVNRVSIDWVKGTIPK